MKTEFEVKILDIDKEKLIEKLISIGAVKVGDKNYRRKVYDFETKEHAWIRLRDDGSKCTLCIKEVQNFNIDGTKEIEVAVDSFEKTDQLLNKLGIKSRAYQENKRTSFCLGNVKLDIDEWPLIPAYLEIEGDNAEQVERVVGLLGFDKEEVTSIDNESIYRKYGIEVNAIVNLKF
ncbi:CYTH domain-containing protein [Candidatus Woesearchaeota archaeon]|nr:CYTH domain-containing protein [Candidatus Woesearchaeota archaeon]MBW3021460.1 CYTH domain-containing protein [Candidatus Woesearchaeota archaeon]